MTKNYPAPNVNTVVPQYSQEFGSTSSTGSKIRGCSSLLCKMTKSTWPSCICGFRICDSAGLGWTLWIPRADCRARMEALWAENYCCLVHGTLLRRQSQATGLRKGGLTCFNKGEMGVLFPAAF